MTPVFRGAAAACIALGLAGCASVAERAAGRLPLEVGRPAGLSEDVLVGRLDVPEDPTRPGARRLPLNVVVVPARTAEPAAPPLFWIVGGPGGAATHEAGLFLGEYARLREERDIVLVDVRGTGGSGALHFGPRGPGAVPELLGEPYPPAWVADNRAALERQADLAQYTTARIADDLDAVRAWLGAPFVDVYGLSYGTRVALEWLRRHPDRVRCAVLQGPAPAALTMPSQHAPAAQAALDLLLAEAAADPACRAALGDARSKLQRVLARLERAPLDLPSPGADGATASRPLSRGAFAEILRRLLYERGTAQAVPLVIDRAEAGDVEWLARLVAFMSGPEDAPPRFAEGLYLCVACAEDAPFLDLELAERLADGTLFGPERVRRQLAACAIWSVPPATRAWREPVSSAVPTLVITGGLDPVTRPEWGDDVVARLPRGRHVNVSAMAHLETGLVLDGVPGTAWFERLLIDFLSTGSAEGLDLRALDRLRPVPFVLEPDAFPPVDA